MSGKLLTGLINIQLYDEIFSGECAQSYDFNGTELENKYVNNANKTHKGDFKIIFAVLWKVIWKNCSGHMVVEFKAVVVDEVSTIINHVKNCCVNFLWIYKWHLRKADGLQRDDCVCDKISPKCQYLDQGTKTQWSKAARSQAKMFNQKAFNISASHRLRCHNWHPHGGAEPDITLPSTNLL